VKRIMGWLHDQIHAQHVHSQRFIDLYVKIEVNRIKWYCLVTTRVFTVLYIPKFPYKLCHYGSFST
jgi:hypothetical protein